LHSDLDIMLKVKSGDLDLLSILFERYKQVLFGFFYRSTSDFASSEDMVQNVFFRILKYRKSFKGYGKFTTWMYRIAHNVLCDHIKKNKGTETDNPERINELTASATLDGDMISEERLRLLQIALRQLKRESREVLIMSRYQGLKYREIADILDCSESVVKVRIFRALMQLKNIYLKIAE